MRRILMAIRKLFTKKEKWQKMQEENKAAFLKKHYAELEKQNPANYYKPIEP